MRPRRSGRSGSCPGGSGRGLGGKPEKSTDDAAMMSLRHIRAILLLPGLVTLAIPALLLWVASRVHANWSFPPPLRPLSSVLGASLVGSGLALLISTVRLFARAGGGTLAPWDPTQKLVVRGVYRRVRNPMISGVFLILLGEAVGFRSFVLFGWFLVFLIGNLIHIPLVEEPALERRFGEAYQAYAEAVPRWIPRTRPWHPPTEELADRPDGRSASE
jgi:protein-S-isoprenylcysteine O-methyltransferase Ste14